MTERIGFFEAMATVHAGMARTPIERLSLIDCLDLITTSPVVAAAPHPAFDCAAMDGFALHHDDLETPGLRIGNAIDAGDAVATLQPGIALPIATGAPIPLNCGAVIQREIAGDVVDGTLCRATVAIAGRNIRKRGEDMRAGDTLLDAGRAITPVLIGTLACAGVTGLAVHRRPRVAIVSSGEELRNGSTSIPDANGPTLLALASRAGAVAHLMAPMPDDAVAVRQSFEALVNTAPDLIVTSGGISVGPRDHVLPVIRQMGAEILFHGVRMRPGKPVLFARLPNGQPMLCLPGNPLAALVGGRFFMLQAIRAAAGLTLETGDQIASVEGREGTALVLKGRRTKDGVEILPGQKSHMLRSLVDADCWIVTSEDAPDGPAHLFPL
jgi:molybdopterin molybdotransferase